MRSRVIWMMSLVCLAAVGARAGEIVFEESFAGYKLGSEIKEPWQSSAAHTGMTVEVASPADAAEGEFWLHLADPVAGPTRSCANIRREMPAFEQGELSFRWHIKSLARFAVYLGTGSASSPEDRVVGFKMHETGRVFLVNDLLDQRPAWALEAGNTYKVSLAFQHRDEENRNVTLVLDDGSTPRKLEAVVPRGEPITAIRFTTENRDAGGDFYLTDLVLTRSDG